MEPVTHFMTGAVLSRAGLNRRAAYATLAMTLAAEAPDLDVLWSFKGPVAGLQHHRGWTHTLLGIPLEAAIVTFVVWLIHCWRRRRNPALSTAAPIRWPLLYLFSLIAFLSHILLDWTNNYGVRPFFPFNPQWYAGSVVFIAEPVLWVIFLAALVFPWLFGITDREIGARSKGPRGQYWALFALTGMVLVWILRFTTQQQALAMLRTQPITTQPVVRATVEPFPVNPFRWHAIVETSAFFQTAEINTRTGIIDSDPQRDVLFKPTETPAVQAAKQTELGKVYLDWGRWAVVRDIGQETVAGVEPPHLGPGRTWTTVEFSDLRFDYAFRGEGRSSGSAVLSGYVYIVDGRDDAGQIMNGREQK